MRLCSQNVFLETGIEVVGPGYVWVPSNPPDKLVKLSKYEHRLLLLLYNNANEVCERDQIVHEVWGGNYMDKVDNQRINKLVSRLRKKIEPDLSHPRCILTEWGYGYKLAIRPRADTC